MVKNVIRRGDIYLADLGDDKEISSEHKGSKYVVVLQNNTGNIFSPTVIVSCITSKNKNNLPTHVLLNKNNYKLTKDSIIMAEQIRTLDKKKLIKYKDKLNDTDMKRLEDSVKISLDIK